MRVAHCPDRCLADVLWQSSVGIGEKWENELPLPLQEFDLHIHLARADADKVVRTRTWRGWEDLIDCHSDLELIPQGEHPFDVARRDRPDSRISLKESKTSQIKSKN